MDITDMKIHRAHWTAQTYCRLGSTSDSCCWVGDLQVRLYNRNNGPVYDWAASSACSAE
jgi:hypothetical protein